VVANCVIQRYFQKKTILLAKKHSENLNDRNDNRPDLGNVFVLERLKEGDRKLFSMLFNYYYSGLVVYAAHFLHDPDMSEDVVQSVFIGLWENRQSIQSLSVRQYLVHSVKNKCIDLIKKEETRKKYTSRQLNLDAVYQGEFYTETELREIIRKSIDKLPPKCREIFILSRFDNLKAKEIAIKLELSPRTVETQILKASKLLREELKDYLFCFLIF
jgi:RNA polymerase sigma-70 factor (ECF subfamily)